VPIASLASGLLPGPPARTCPHAKIAVSADRPGIVSQPGRGAAGADAEELFGPVSSDPVVPRLIVRLAGDAPRALTPIRWPGAVPGSGRGRWPGK
jgi:hypothetical protein